MRHGIRFFVLVSILALGFSGPSARTWHIRPDGTGDVVTIQVGIDSAAAGDTVLLASGTYTGVGNRDIDFLGKAIVVTSEGGRDVTIIDCEQLGRGFLFQNSEGPSSILSGVTIQNGFLSCDGSGAGGAGIYCSTASPVIENNAFIGNKATCDVGAIWLGGPEGVIRNCIFRDNEANAVGAIWDLGSGVIVNNVFIHNKALTGGAIKCFGSNTSISNNSFVNNSVGLVQTEGVISCYYSTVNVGFNVFESNAENAVFCFSSSVSIASNTFRGNGTGVIVDHGSSCGVTGNTFASNRCGLVTFPSNASIIENNIFVGNDLAYDCQYDGPGSQPIWRNNTLIQNRRGIEIYGGSGVNPTIQNSIIAFTVEGPGIECMLPDASPIITCCDICGNAGGDSICGIDGGGNIHEDPLFCDPANGDYTLFANSSCLGGACGQIGAKPMGCGTVCQISPSSLDFGEVYKGDSRDRSFMVKNVGFGILAGDISETCDCFSILSGDGSYAIAAGESLVVTVRFAPTQMGEFTCVIETGSLCQEVSCTGHSPVTRWVVDGIPICTAPEEEFGPNIAMVDSNAAIVTWVDHRGNKAICAQKIDVDGNQLWPQNGVEIVRNVFELPFFWNPSPPQIAPDGTGGAFIAFDVNLMAPPGVANLYIQRVTASGSIELPSERVVPQGATCWMTRAIAGGDGTALIATTAGDRKDILLMRRYPADTSGYAEPLTIGLDLTPAPYYCRANPELIATGDSGAIVVWTDSLGDETIPTQGNVYAQRAVILPGHRVTLWAQGGIPICNAPGVQCFPQIVTDGADGAIITWEDTRDGRVDIYAQRINSSGTRLWNIDGVPICTQTGLPADISRAHHSLASDGMGGAVIVWEDCRNGTADIYAQRIDGSGAPFWQSNGKAICSAAGNQTCCKVVPSEIGRVVICWQDERNGNSDVYAQKVAPTGCCYWPEGGVPISIASGSQAGPQIAADNSGGAMIAWRDDRYGNGDIFMQRVREYVAPVATLLQNFSAAVEGSAITVKWELSEAGDETRFVVLRCVNPPGAFSEDRDATVVAEGLSFSYRDADISPGTSYSYRVEVLDKDGRRTLFETGTVSLPAMPLTLFQNHPNPFNPATMVSYFLPDASQVTLSIYDLAGRLITRIVDRETNCTGMHQVQWKGKDDRGKAVASGVYFYRLTAGKQTISRKMVLLR
jgi:hypothetical protein